MIQLVVLVTAKPGQRGKILDAFKAVVPTVHTEKGCIEYGAFVDIPDYGHPQTAIGADSFFIVEKWETIADLKAHAKAPHMADYAGKVKDLVESRRVHLLQPA